MTESKAVRELREALHETSRQALICTASVAANRKRDDRDWQDDLQPVHNAARSIIRKCAAVAEDHACIMGMGCCGDTVSELILSILEGDDEGTRPR